MNYLRHTIKYILWVLLAALIALVLIGIVKYDFDVKWYIDYLNTRNIQEVSVTNPITLYRIFVPAERTEPITLEALLEEEDDVSSWSLDVDMDFESFFGDFNQQDRASLVMTGADFGFVSEPMQDQWETWSIELTEEEKKQLFIEQLRLRELRLQEEAQIE